MRILAALAGKANLADFQNTVSVAGAFSSLSVTDADVKELQLAATTVPAFLNPQTRHIDNLGAEQTVYLSVLDLSLACASFERPRALSFVEHEPHDARNLDRTNARDS